ncbi:MAG: hypothetical protein AAGA83_14725, partial [Cyanobacteria bacterium P01_F01_bin.116]
MISTNLALAVAGAFCWAAAPLGAVIVAWAFELGALSLQSCIYIVRRPAPSQQNYHHHSRPSLPVKATHQAKLAA